MPPKNLGIGSTMKGFENGTVVKELSERGVERYKEGIVNPRVANVVAYGGNKKRQGVKRLQDGCEHALLGRAARVVLWVRRYGPELDQEMKHGLQNVDDMAKVVVVHEIVVRRAAGVEIHHQVVWIKLASPAKTGLLYRQRRPKEQALAFAGYVEASRARRTEARRRKSHERRKTSSQWPRQRRPFCRQ
jgi:hypothetical protein